MSDDQSQGALSELETYRWSGVNPRGDQHSGRMTLHPGSLKGFTEGRYRQGWRSLAVCSGDGPVPPSFADQHRVAAIEPHPETGKRTWWAEVPVAEQ